MKCPTCRQMLPEPAPHPDGMPGVLYRTCRGCGTAVVARRSRARAFRIQEERISAALASLDRSRLEDPATAPSLHQVLASIPPISPTPKLPS